VPDLNYEEQDLLLEVVDLKQEVPDLRSGGTPPQFNHWALAVDLLNIYDIIFARYVPAYIATRKWRVQLKVTPRVATPGAESAVHRLPVDKVVA